MKNNFFYSGDEISLRTSVLCGYWCIYYLNEREKGETILETIHNPNFEFDNKKVNNEFIKKYFLRGLRPPNLP